MAEVVDPAPCAPRSSAARPLVLLLPGRGMAVSELQAQGFVAAIRRRGFDVDVHLVDAHLGYWRERVVFEALREDVLAPARARGVQEIWLAGISLGGYGALLYDARHPQEIAGVVALAPYLGADDIVDEIARASGLRDWPPPVLPPFQGAPPAEEADRHLWRWLKAQAFPGTAGAPPARTLPVFLSFGRDDRFAKAHQLMAAALPADRTVVAAGGHDWPAWQAGWEGLLDRMPWPRRPDCVPSPLQR